MPLLPNGQEFGEDHFVPEDDHGTGRRVTSRPLQWKLHDDPIGQPLVALHGTLARMRRDHPGLRSGLMYPDVWEAWQTQPNPAGVGVDVASQIVIYHRWAVLESGSVENFVIVINFSGTDAIPSVPFPVDGEWIDLLAGFDGSGSSWSATVLGLSASIPVGSHWGRILWRLNPPH